jgi:hypothetical protein
MPVMGWVRFHNRRYGAWPGLAALVLQLVLSFGHIHVGNVHINGSAWASTVAAANTHHVAPTQQKLPAQNPSDDDDYCAVCASIFLASTSFMAEPPKLPVPTGFERIALTFTGVEIGISAPRRAPFQSRAPPAA